MGRIRLWTLLVISSLAFGGAVSADVFTLNPVRDNTLYEHPAGALSNGAGEYFFAGRTLEPTNSLRRSVLAFDVAGTIPPGTTINSAQLTLRMSMTISGPVSVELHRVEADWGEGSSNAPGEEGMGAPAAPGDATWIHTFFSNSFWLDPGGDFDPVASAVQTVGGNGNYTWGSTPEMVADVQSWLDEPANNWGWLLLADEKTDASAKRFNSRENGNQSTIPERVINCDLPVPTTPWVGLILMTATLLAAALYLLRRRSAGMMR